MSVAVPWSLSHYIPLNGFHPLYRALVDHAPRDVALNAWDNVKLHDRLAADDAVRDRLLKAASLQHERDCALGSETLARAYRDHFWPPNQVLTEALGGDIEFHHTAPFPSLSRPFVFHCESFAPVFLPFAGQGSGAFARPDELREHYRRILAHPLCLGIFSHIPETLNNLSRFFADAGIDRRLHSSRIGISGKMAVHADEPDAAALERPRFLFINSAHQDGRNFFLRGGHLVLRFWHAFKQSGRDGTLLLRCAKPDDAALKEHGVDLAFLSAETGRSVFWAQDYLAGHELNALLASAHFFLLPGLSLHSVSIMQAMAAGAVPIVTDTVGTSVYVTDDETGIVLRGVRDALVQPDPNTGALVDSYGDTRQLEPPLVEQLMRRIVALLDAPQAYLHLRARCCAHARRQFSGEAFSDQFWGALNDLYGQYRMSAAKGESEPQAPSPISEALSECTLQGDRWAAVFESVTRPMRRIYTGHSSVFEYGGAFVHTYGRPRMAKNDWSPVAQYYSADAQPTTFAETLPELRGKYLAQGELAQEGVGRHWLVDAVSRALMPLPGLHSFAARVLGFVRRHRRPAPATGIVPDGGQDIELMRQGVHGFNVIRYARGYYAIPQGEGAFEPEKVKAGAYSSCLSGSSVEDVLQQLAVAVARRRQPAPVKREAHVELVVEGLHGFNIVRVDATFYAILQRDGAFRLDKAMSNGYRCLFSGRSAEEVKEIVLSFIASNPPKRRGWRRKYVEQTFNPSVDI
ncbi:hypothetical protein WKR88_22250 [Trinickia caryophylli]|nr:glycosyltransferase family 4 protein [Trinickia caryophylli]PMS11271.1 hypothetical protein C0Z17_15760 [Trinickia caryophylli]TRX20124.1 glycosyltransferase family 4 protein [Trinickia caryophylli]WQE12525.1 hypothetical protein U0034_03625 [Trinickia caryophylli]GLU30210.1 hypothetical protein Busp01_00520 [Trinickia caryophylli]